MSGPRGAVVFDADETLVDLRPAVTGALVAVLEEMRRRTPAAAGVVLEDLEGDWGAVFGALSAAPVQEIRRAALTRSLARAGLEADLDEFAALFFARRYALSRPFPDVLPALAALRPHHVLGFATNGNSRAERCGLAGQFAFELYAHEGGLPKKPAPEFYAAVAAATGLPAARIVHVGDSPEHDVVAAQRAGLRAVWLNRAGLPRPRGLEPDAEVSTLAGLSTVLTTLTNANA
ncbi:haloacid dehalogenase [Micromonospora tulbaghiae]|uniref:Haloacid dehalogenase n=1 Tax=Micromonospora tulbaghiae TaxID=479978 RepID=A0A386WTF5_9ACTN|nr:HAD family hydrolase [Micromonospora tulbaghiae]AYF31272.1 haloacid dehalogenase [Micromonospora tulbaghiae]